MSGKKLFVRIHFDLVDKLSQLLYKEKPSIIEGVAALFATGAQAGALSKESFLELASLVYDVMTSKEPQDQLDEEDLLAAIEEAETKNKKDPKDMN